jgi:hypothetical protein
MIVQPDFLDHWKVNALAARIGRLEAITALLALWSHCQQRRQWRFEFTPLMLAGICRYNGDNPRDNPRVLMDTLLELNLIEKDENGVFEVHEWAEMNASLVHNWGAGKKGGRPPKQPKDKPLENPRVTPRQTQGEPEGEPIREDKRREESTPIIPKGMMSDGDSIVSDEGALVELEPDVPLGKKRKGRGAVSEEAGRVYELYPRKVGRDAALVAIQKRLDAGVEVELLVERVGLFAAAVERWPAAERVFVPHPATWFNQGRFEDDPAEWRRDPAGVSWGHKKNGGAAAAAEVKRVVDPEWDWRVVWRRLWPESEPPGELVRWGHLDASVRFELRQEWDREQD